MLGKVKKQKIVFDYVILFTTFCLILFLGIKKGQKFIKLLPTLVSLVVYLLASWANRFNYLLGAFNSILYSISFFSERLYASMVSALIFGFGLQIITFFRWKKRAYGRATVFRKFSLVQEIILVVCFVCVWLLITTVVKLFPSAQQAVSDALGFVAGNGAMILMAFAFIEALPFYLINTLNSLHIWIRTVINGNTANLTYVVSMCFSLYCTVFMCIKWIKIYKAQQFSTEGGGRMILGKIVKELAPSETNARNSEGAFIRMDDGRIAFAYSRYSSKTHNDGEACDIAVCFSLDEGETFCEPKIFLTHEDCDAFNIMSVSLLKMNDGSIGVFYLKKSRNLQCGYYMRRTFDFVSFTDEVRCISEDGYFTVNNDRVRRLKSGRIVFPSAYFALKKLTQNADHDDYSKVLFSKAIAKIHYSDDDGATWHTSKSIAILESEISSTGLQEPGVEELDDGRLYFYYRNDLGRQYQAYSVGENFILSKPEPSLFTSPQSPLSSKRLSNNKIAIVYNPIPLYNGRKDRFGNTFTGGRNPLVIRFTDGNFANLEEIIEIENDESRGFCYCTIFETQDSLLLAYCAGGAGEPSTLVRTRIRKILKKDLF